MSEQKEYQYCLRCGRRLKNAEARIKGYGIVCEKKMKHARQNRLFEEKICRDRV